jgi:hypothetical protein
MVRFGPTLLLLAACSGDQKVGTFDTKPTVTISQPADGTAFEEGDQIDFVALADDAQTPSTDLGVQWISSIDGELTAPTPPDSSGQVLYSTASLTDGNHVITLTVTDDAAQTAEATVAITVNDVPDSPKVNVIHPASGESGIEGESFRFAVQVSDSQDPPDTLTIAFESDVDGVFCTPTADATGLAECEQALSAGDHQLTFRVTDRDALSTTEEVYFTVVAGTSRDDDGDGWTEDQGDCNDGDGSVHPNAPEIYNERDDDCDGVIDDGTAGYDDDGDGVTELDGDCDDASAATFPGATELCDGFDNDCDRTIDETTVCYDDDGDGWTETDGDCNDASGISHPGASEIADGLDNDCDGVTDEGTANYDDDGDGYSEAAGDCDDTTTAVSPAAAESCDGYDNDCDGSRDETGASGCITYYYDYDRDGYGSTASQCLCSSSGYYTSAYSNDCYDYNASANPAATSWFASSRGDGSYDYNCDGTESHYYTSTGSCSWDVFTCPYTTGWAGRDPGCAGSASYLTGCDLSGFPYTSCNERTSTYSQSCR